MKNTIYLSTFITFFILSACQKIVLGPEGENSPESNFEYLWNDFDQHYALFDIRGLNWDSIYTLYQPQITENTSDEELWAVFKEMIEYLDDSHTVIFKGEVNSDNDDDYYVSGFALGTAAEEAFSLDLLEDKYIDPMTYILDEEFGYGKVTNKDIGYMYLGVENDFDPDRIEEVIAAFQQYEAIILDM